MCQRPRSNSYLQYVRRAFSSASFLSNSPAVKYGRYNRDNKGLTLMSSESALPRISTDVRFLKTKRYYHNNNIPESETTRFHVRHDKRLPGVRLFTFPCRFVENNFHSYAFSLLLYPRANHSTFSCTGRFNKRFPRARPRYRIKLENSLISVPRVHFLYSRTSRC